MFGKAMSFGGLLLLAGALVLVTPSLSQAQHRGGGHGGFHGGGFHGGGFHGGGFHGGHHHSSHHHHGVHRYFGLGFYPYYYPSYGGYYPPNSYYPSNGYYSPYSYYPSYDLSYSSAPDQRYLGLYSEALADTTAHVTVRLPVNAQLWFNDSKTTSTGSVREFQTPPLTPGRHTYVVRVRWTENGRDITQTQTVAVSPGAKVTVDFPVRSGTD